MVGYFINSAAHFHSIAIGIGRRAIRQREPASVTRSCADQPEDAPILPQPPCAKLFGRNDNGANGGSSISEAAGPLAAEQASNRAERAGLAGPPRLTPTLSAPRFPRRIETSRLILEMPAATELRPLQEMTADPSMFRYSERGPMSPEDSWSLQLRHIGHWLVAGYGVFTAREKASGQFVGQVGASAFHRNLGRDFDEFPEMTWSIAAPFRGRGYATEAATAVLAALDGQSKLRAAVCLIHIDNQASLRIAAKTGFRFFRYCDYRGYPAGLFKR